MLNELANKVNADKWPLVTKFVTRCDCGAVDDTMLIDHNGVLNRVCAQCQLEGPFSWISGYTYIEGPNSVFELLEELNSAYEIDYFPESEVEKYSFKFKHPIWGHRYYSNTLEGAILKGLDAQHKATAAIRD